MNNNKTSMPIKKSSIYILIAILTLLIATASYFYYKSQENSIRQEKYNELKAIADLKESQIENWLHERNADVKVVTQSPFFSDAVALWLQDIGNLKLKNDIIKRLKPVQKELGYKNISLAKTNGELLLSANDSLAEFDTFLKQKITEASIKKEIVFTDFYLSQKENKIYFDIIAPIIYNENTTIAVLIFRRDPNDFLYPLIQDWPTPSKSAETAILRVENDSVIFLNELRHRKNTAMKLKISLTQTDAPCTQAALGRVGIFQGIDYRGIKVLSDIRIIQGANWIMISSVDKSEIFAGLYSKAFIIAGFCFLLVVVVGVGFFGFYNDRQHAFYKELFNKEKELIQQQERFKVTMDSLGEGVITVSLDGKVQYMNNLAEDLTGWNLREARDRGHHEVYPVKNEETGQKENNIFDIVLKHGVVKQLANHTILISKIGKEIPVMDIGAPIYDTDGSIIGIVIAFQDETEKRKQRQLLIESEEKFRTMTVSAKDAIIMIDNEGNISFWNESAERLFGYSYREALGIGLHKLLAPHSYHSAYIKGMKNFKLTGEGPIIGKTSELEAVKKDGTEFPIELSISAVKIKGKWNSIGIIRDITERKRAEMELITAKNNAEEANRLKSGFLSAMSHEIRTPLNAILGYSGLLKDYFYDSGDKEIKHSFNSIENGSLRLLDTITKILDMSTIESGDFPINIRSYALNEIVCSTYNLLENMASSKGLKFKMDLLEKEINILADDYCINSVLLNIINNAIKFSEKGTITIQTRIVDGKAECKVSDEGIGMSEEYLKHIYESFSQETVGISRPYEGTGLGLAISKKYLALINGEIEVESKKGVGTTVTIKLPLDKYQRA